MGKGEGRIPKPKNLPQDPRQPRVTRTHTKGNYSCVFGVFPGSFSYRLDLRSEVRTSTFDLRTYNFRALISSLHLVIRIKDMPTYEYVCEKCGHQFEQVQPISAKALTTCPQDRCS